ncbi:MAG TPA: flagellar basal body protein [Gammaproteobacteria bacterium]|nr:flagellar basal body protein [Gammaproteobacteria bacterium]
MPLLNSLNYYGQALEVGARVANLTAANIANADTPGYKARGLDFKRALDARLQTHDPVRAQYVRGLPVGLDGNNVSLGYEAMQAASNAARMRESLAFLKGDTQSLITALRPQANGQGG